MKQKKEKNDWLPSYLAGKAFLAAWKSRMSAKASMWHRLNTSPDEALSSTKRALSLIVICALSAVIPVYFRGNGGLQYIVALIVALMVFGIAGLCLWHFWPGFAAISLATKWWSVRRILEKTDVLWHIKASLPVDRQKALYLHSYPIVPNAILCALEERAVEVRNAEIEGKPLTRRFADYRFRSLHNVAYKMGYTGDRFERGKIFSRVNY